MDIDERLAARLWSNNEQDIDILGIL